MRTLIFCLFTLLSCGLSAQTYQSRIHYKVEIGDTSQLHQLILLDYTKLLGTAMEVRADSLYFQIRSTSEPSVIPLNKLRYLGVFVVADSPEDKRRFFSKPPAFGDMTYERTALPLEGKGQVRVINALYGVVEWNLNDNLQLGAGLGGPLGFIFTQKLRFSVTPDLHFGLVGQEMWLPLIGSFSGQTILIGDIGGIVTLGNERRFINAGTGIFFNTDDSATPVQLYRFGIGGKAGERWHLYSEALVSLPKNDRRFGRLGLFPSLNASYANRRHRWQFGVFTFFEDESGFFPPPLPYIGYAYYW